MLFVRLAKKTGIRDSAISPDMIEEAPFFLSKYIKMGIATASDTKANLRRREIPVATIFPSESRSFQTLPPNAVTPVEIPPSARIVIAPSIVLAIV